MFRKGDKIVWFEKIKESPGIQSHIGSLLEKLQDKNKKVLWNVALSNGKMVKLPESELQAFKGKL